MIDSAEASRADEDLKALDELRANPFFLRRILPQLERVRDEHRAGMVNPTLSCEARCEHITGWQVAQELLEFAAKEEAALREALKEHDDAAPFIDRPFR